MLRYSVRYRCASSGVRSGHAIRKISSSGNPVIAPTLSKASGDPPCASMTRFAVSTTKRTLSVSVPSRSHKTARSVTTQLPTQAPRVLPRLGVLARSQRIPARTPSSLACLAGPLDSRSREPNSPCHPRRSPFCSATSTSGRDRDHRLDRQRRLFRELAAVELLARPVTLHDLDARGLGALAGREPLATGVAGATPPDRVAILRL